MKIRLPHIPRQWIWATGLLVAIVVGWYMLPVLRDSISPWVVSTIEVFRDAGSDQQSDRNEKDDGSHAGSTQESIRLSAQARRNLGLTRDKLLRLELQTFFRSITVPAVVVERPGRSRIQVAAPLTGVVTGVHVIKGEAVPSGRLLFRLRLTHEDLVQAQTQFLRTLGELDVEDREIARLEKIAEKGVVAGKLLLERQYAKQKLVAVLNAHREALGLHGLAAEQVSRIESQRKLLRELTVSVPFLHHDSSIHDDAEEAHAHRVPSGHTAPVKQVAATQPPADSASDETVSREFVVHQLNVHPGQAVRAGDSLCVLVDFSRLYIEGHALLS